MNAIKLCKSLVVMLLFVFQAHSQFTILENTVVQVGSDIDFISQSNVTNNGTFSFGESTFILDADLTNTGTIDLSEATLKLGTANSTGTYDLNFSEAQPIDVRQLILESNSASFTADVSSAGSLRVIGSLESISGILNANEKIILSNTTATDAAQVKESTGGIVKDIVVERFIPAKRAFRFLTSPVTSSQSINANLQEGQNNVGTSFPSDNENNIPNYGTHITGSQTGDDGFDASLSGNPSMFLYNQTSQSWEAVTNTDVKTLQTGTAYRLMVRGSRAVDLTTNTAAPSITTLRTRGELHIGDFSPSLATGDSKFSFIANPYQAVVDFEAVEKSELTDYIYMWEARFDDGGANPRGKYVTVDVPNNSNSSSSLLNKFIMPGQSFFVQNIESPFGSPSITFKEVHKKVDEPQVSPFSSPSDDVKATIKLYKAEVFQEEGGETDAAVLRFDSGYQTQATSEDAVKFWNPDESMAILNNGYRSIDKRNFPDDNEAIPLFFHNYRSSDYVLSVELDTELPNTKMFLKDNYLESLTEVGKKLSYPFEVDASTDSSNSERFSLVFENVTLSQEDFENLKVSAYPNPSKGLVTIQAESPVEGIEVFDLQGRSVLKVSGSSHIDLSGFMSGVYLLHISTNKGKTIKKIIKN